MPEITKQDVLRWLDMQRDAINTEIAYAAPDDKAQYHGNLKIVNWLAEAARVYSGEITAVEYCEAHDELCKAHQDCQQCPLDNCCTSVDTFGGIKKAVEIVKQWKEEQS